MLRFLQRHFLTGLLSITPLVITSWILWRVYVLISTTMRPMVARIPSVAVYPEFFLTLTGVVVFIMAITLVGLFTRNVIGVAFFRMVERFFLQIPIVKSLFSTTKQIAAVFLQDRRTAFQKVVVFAYPRAGLYSIGFVTWDEGGDLVNVFLPTAPNPTSGYMLLVPRSEMTEVPIPVEEAIKLIVSGGSIMTDDQARSIHAAWARTADASSTADETTAGELE